MLLTPDRQQAIREASASRIALLKSEVSKLNTQTIEKTAEVKVLERDFIEMVKQLQERTHQVEVHEKASIVLKELIRQVSTENLYKVEALVNSAIHSVMPDKRISFKISSVIRRDMTEYEFSIVRPGSSEEGSVESSGGGLFAIIALVLKITFNILSKKAPLIVLDESLAFVSEQYIIPVSTLIQQLAKEFNITVVLVTHQQLFSESSDVNYLAYQVDGETQMKKTR